MKVRNYGGANETLLEFNDGSEILFSYGTPVAGFIPGHSRWSTVEHYSQTTTRHINKYHDGRKAETGLMETGAIAMVNYWRCPN